VRAPAPRKRYYPVESVACCPVVQHIIIGAAAPLGFHAWCVTCATLEPLDGAALTSARNDTGLERFVLCLANKLWFSRSTEPALACGPRSGPNAHGAGAGLGGNQRSSLPSVNKGPGAAYVPPPGPTLEVLANDHLVADFKKISAGSTARPVAKPRLPNSAPPLFPQGAHDREIRAGKQRAL
jgi:hypothetical protein